MVTDTERPLDGDQMPDHLQHLGVLLVGVRPAGDLVQVRSDPFQLGVRDRPGPHPANMSVSLPICTTLSPCYPVGSAPFTLSKALLGCTGMEIHHEHILV